MSEILWIALLTGEELVAKATFEGDVLTVEKPLQIVKMQEGQSMKLGMMPFMPYIEDDIKLHQYAMVSTAPEDMANQWRQYAGDIILPSTKIQLA